MERADQLNKLPLYVRTFKRFKQSGAEMGLAGVASNGVLGRTIFER